MHALLKLSLLGSGFYLCWQVIRYLRSGDYAHLQKTTRRLRGFALLNGALLLAWLVLLVRK